MSESSAGVYTAKYCAKCGAELKENALFCAKCGEKIQEIPKPEVRVAEKAEETAVQAVEIKLPIENTLPVENKPKRKIKGTYIAVCCAALAAVVGSTLLYFSQPINKYKHNLNSRKFDMATYIYDENISNPKFAEKAEVVIEDFVADTVLEYKNDKIDYDEAMGNIKGVEKVFHTDSQEFMFGNIKRSRESFEYAVTAVEGQNYDKALAYLEKVVYDDGAYYERAQNLLADTKGKYQIQQLEQVNAKITQNDWVGAYKLLSAIPKQYVDNELNKLIIKAKAPANTEIKAAVTEMFANGDYLGAYKYLADFNNDNLIQEMRDAKTNAYNLFSQQALEKAAAAVSASNDYQGAIGILKDAQSKIEDLDFSGQIYWYEIEEMKAAQKLTVVSVRTARSYTHSGKREATVVVKNNSDKVIVGFKAGILLFDNNGNPVETTQVEFGENNLIRCISSDANIKPGTEFGENRYFLVDAGATKVKVCVRGVEFADGTIWENEYYDYWLDAEQLAY